MQAAASERPAGEHDEGEREREQLEAVEPSRVIRTLAVAGIMRRRPSGREVAEDDLLERRRAALRRIAA